jgi:hypothetical protein
VTPFDRQYPGLAELDNQRQADIPESDNADLSLVVFDLIQQIHELPLSKSDKKQYCCQKNLFSDYDSFVFMVATLYIKLWFISDPFLSAITPRFLLFTLYVFCFTRP